MALATKVEPIDRDVELIISETLSPQAQSAILAKAAREQLATAEHINETVLGRIPPHQTYVDGGKGRDEDDVKPDGTIIYEFDLVVDLFKWIARELTLHAPVKSGRFAQSFTFYADGVEVDVGAVIPPDAQEYTFLNAQPYSRKIEKGESKQAPDGVFQAVALLARAKFGNVAKVQFVYRAPLAGKFLTARQGGNKSDNRVPAIAISLK